MNRTDSCISDLIIVRKVCRLRGKRRYNPLINYLLIEFKKVHSRLTLLAGAKPEACEFLAQNVMATNGSNDPVLQCEYHIDTPTERVFKCIAYFIILFGSLFGNVLVICVVILNRQMRTVTNYLIVNMAVADLLLTAFNMPVTIKLIATGTMDWSGGVFADILCKILPFIQYLSIASSVLSLAAIAIDRFLAIMYPLKRYITFPISYGMIAIVWIVGIGVNSPILYAMEIIVYEADNQSYCFEIWTPAFKEEANKDFTIVLFVVFYVVPLLTMSVLYSFVVHELWVRKVPGNQTAENQQRNDKSRKKVLKMLLAVVILFALCWLPVYINQFILFFDQENFPCGPPATLAFMGYFLGHANSAINPAIYVIFNSNFRKGFRDLLLCRCRRNRVFPLTQAGTATGAGNTHMDGASVAFARVRPGGTSKVSMKSG